MFDPLPPNRHRQWKAPRSSLSAYTEKYFLPNWWVILLALLFYAGYERSTYQSCQQYQKLTSTIQTLHEEKTALQIRNDQLQQQIQSQTDPAYIELTLMKVLGLVPEGKQKAVLKN